MSNKKIDQEMDISYMRAEIASKMQEIVNILEENSNEVWPHEEVEDVTHMLVHLKQLTKNLPSDSEYRAK